MLSSVLSSAACLADRETIGQSHQLQRKRSDTRLMFRPRALHARLAFVDIYYSPMYRILATCTMYLVTYGRQCDKLERNENVDFEFRSTVRCETRTNIVSA